MAGVCAVYFSFGAALGAMPPLVDEISADLSLSRSTMGSILGAWALIYVFTAIPGGAIVDRLGLRTALTIGGITITASLILRCVATGPWSLFAAVAIFGIGGPLVSVSAPKLVASLFDESGRRLPTGLTVSSPTLGSTVALALTNPVLLPLTDDRWRGVLLIFAAVAAVATLCWLAASRGLAPHVATTKLTDTEALRRLLTLPSMRWILFMSLFVFFFSHALNAWLPEVLTDIGQSDNNAGYLAALSATVGIAGSLSIARLVATAHRTHALVVIFAVLAIAVVGLTALPTPLLIAALLVLGFFRSGLIPLLFLEIMGHPRISVADIGAATGLFFAVGEIGGFTGPYVLGLVAERTDGFAPAMQVLAAVAVLGAAAAIGLRRERARRVGQAAPSI